MKLNILPGVLAYLLLGSALAIAADHEATDSVSALKYQADDDACLEQARDRLMILAFDAASALPVDPHVKDRSRAQQHVVDVALELGRLEQAADFAERIGNYRRGIALADVATQHAKRGENAVATRLLKRAAIMAGQEIEWRRDRIHVHMATAYAIMGDESRAGALEADVADSEVGKVDRSRASSAGVEAFDVQVERLDTALKTAQFDQVKHALQATAALYERFYADESRRVNAERSIKNYWQSMPIMVRVETMMSLTRAALAHEDLDTAQRLIAETTAIIDTYEWLPEYRMPLAAKIGVLQHRAGQRERAVEQLAATLTLYDGSRETIATMNRAATLRPIAEAYSDIGDADQAKVVYRLTIEEGAVNPNARPRAIDLSATCASMARHSVQPSDEMWERVQAIRAGLKQPW